MSKARMEIELGDEVEDKVTGFKGIAIARHTYLEGCDRISIQPKIKKDGELIDAASFDEPTVKIVRRNTVKPAHLEELEVRKTGGPRDHKHTPRR